MKLIRLSLMLLSLVLMLAFTAPVGQAMFHKKEERKEKALKLCLEESEKACKKAANKRCEKKKGAKKKACIKAAKETCLTTARKTCEKKAG